MAGCSALIDTFVATTMIYVTPIHLQPVWPTPEARSCSRAALLCPPCQWSQSEAAALLTYQVHRGYEDRRDSARRLGCCAGALWLLDSS
jgi:hypothetical protein